MKKAYTQLMELNHDLVTGYKIRTGNHLEFLECLKLVNQSIQKSGRLRGKHSYSCFMLLRVLYSGIRLLATRVLLIKWLLIREVANKGT